MTDDLDFPPLVRDLTAAGLRERVQETRRRERRVITAFVNAAAVGDTAGFGHALSKGLEFYILGRCLNALMRFGWGHDAVRADFAFSVKTIGDGFRQELRRDLDLVKALRLLLPRYQGEGLSSSAALRR